MSVYRTLGRASINDLYAEQIRKPEDARPEQPPAYTIDRLREQEAHRRERKGEPANVPLPRTLAWAASLPRQVPLGAVLHGYPRIANLLAAAWNDHAELSAYLDELTVDRRGNRQGFPTDVLTELAALRNYHAGLHPESLATWRDTDKRD